MWKIPSPTVATVVINVKGADLLFLDHTDASELQDRDKAMWAQAGVDFHQRPFGRVLVYVPLQEDGFTRHSLRSNPAADIDGYSETREFTLGIQDIWPYLDLFFETRTSSIANLLAEIADYFCEQLGQETFTLANVLHLFKAEIRLTKQLREERWKDFHSSTIQTVSQHFRSLPTTLGGLIDVTGTGFGLDTLADLRPYDLIVVDLERLLANPPDPAIAQSSIKMITAFIFRRLTEAMTQRTCAVDHIIVFADELNSLAPRHGDGGIGRYLAQLARTTRDRGIVLFGAGQFRSGINEDLLNAASVHYSMQTPEQELGDRMYQPLSSEVKARLTHLQPGETLIQYPALRTAVFASFPLPFVFSGATKWRERFPPVLKRNLAVCVWERLQRLDPQHPLHYDEVKQLLESVFQGTQERQAKILEKEVIVLLREVEIEHAHPRGRENILPWKQFSELLLEKYGKRSPHGKDRSHMPMPANFLGPGEEWI
jgi:hypothetical protein